MLKQRHQNTESPFHHVVIVFRSAYAAVNYRRLGLSSRCSPCLELSASARHVCTVSFHLPKPSEDSPLQPLLSSCQAREVISSLRPFLLLLHVFNLVLFSGPKGPPGPTGATGVPGILGLRGEVGRPGPLGSTGARGPRGPTGHASAAGQPGPPGPRGPYGYRGPKGATGETTYIIIVVVVVVVIIIIIIIIILPLGV